MLILANPACMHSILTLNAQGYGEWNEFAPNIDGDRTHSTRSRQSLCSTKLKFALVHIMFWAPRALGI